MSSSDRDVLYVQNPAFGAVVLWRFVCGYYTQENRSVPFPLLFIVLPVVFRKDLCEAIKSTQKASGLSKMSQKLFKNKENDIIHLVNNTAIQMRALSLDSFNIAVEANLISLTAETATVIPSTTSFKYTLKSETKDIMAAAEKLGIWCSKLTMFEIAKELKVRF